MAKALPPGTSAQKPELIASTRTLELLQKKTVNVYTNSKYTFLILYAHGSIWKAKRTVNLQIKRRISMQQKF